jgi:hypothetical protein
MYRRRSARLPEPLALRGEPGSGRNPPLRDQKCRSPEKVGIIGADARYRNGKAACHAGIIPYCVKKIRLLGEA